MVSPAVSEKVDDVLIVMDIWDVPLSGVTMFQGAFHSFQRLFDEASQAWSKSDDFLLQRLTGAELKQFNELNDLYVAWLAAYKEGKAGPHPRIPEAAGADAERYRELHSLIDAILHSETDRTIRCKGKITRLPGEARYAARWQF
jgi:hypothetical protein